MKAIAVVLTSLAVVAALVMIGMAYVGIFTHDDTLGNAAFLTLCIDVALGFGAGLAWSVR